VDPKRSPESQRRSPRRALRRPARARAGAEAGRHLRLGADDRGDRPRPAARPGVLAQPPLAHDVQPARPLRRRDDPRAGARRVLADQPGRAHVDLQAPRGRALPRRPGADLRRRQVHLRPALREVAREVGLHRGGPRRAHGALRGEVPDEGALRGAPRGARRLLGLHPQRGRDQEARRPQHGRPRHGPLHAAGLEGRAADGPQAPPALLQEGAAPRGRGHPPDHPGRGEYRRGAPHGPDPPRLPRGQQELQPPEGREDADRLPELPSRLRLPQHQREPRAAPGRPRATGDQLGRGSEPGAARRRLGVRPAHGARDRAHEAVAASRGAVDALLQARRGSWPTRARPAASP